jgi:hypothetical protein
MFELHVVVAAVVMLNILELIMEIMPNYPTEPSSRFYAGGGGSHLWTLPRRRAERHGGSPVLKSSIHFW